MWKILKKHSNKNLETYYFKENATRDVDGYIVDFQNYRNTKVEIDNEQKLFHIQDHKEAYTWGILDKSENKEFNLKFFIVEDESKNLKKITIFNNDKLTIKNNNSLKSVKHIFGRPGCLYEEQFELSQRFKKV
ncbi:hypothetical protein EC396_15995 [Lutibacter sp. HS1-25]|uniref:hypothetical protein n=1 Tax=Lutibacter sp. HS1-25 TaxID=2485000 RepID=UPI0010112F18|nr:hypothetical protein [Lutibacter sp. HS1-25]RXP45192.1 hypothetical protein EC396_15995 [Lutibacter sp. HS1-25]